MEKRILEAYDRYPLELHLYEAKEAKAVVQIVHGMEEHQGRYTAFAQFLQEHGFSVVSSDMRGHGPAARMPGHFKDKNGYVALIRDQRRITAFIQKRFPGLPIYLFAHSMGTMIVRVLLQTNSRDYQKVVLSGYPNYQKGAYFGIVLANVVQALCGPKYKSKFIQAQSVGAFNRQIRRPKTTVDWISHNEENVREYLSDPNCGIGFTCAAFRDVFSLMIRMHRSERYRNVNQNLPFLLLRGLDDPCVGGEQGAADSRRTLLQAGFFRIIHMDFLEMRHEILRERECQKVYDAILAFYREQDRL